MKVCCALFVLTASLICLTQAESENGASAEKNFRKSKLLPIFQVVNFPNDLCGSSDNRNGTCYTSEECSNKGGSSLGSCASGYGVCCVFSLSCGGSSSENTTYITQASTTSLSSNPCNYKICKCSSDICRIRFDFVTHVTADPATGTVVVMATGNAVTSNGGSIGDCLTDQFSITSSGNKASPVICGFNSGQHMIVDASESCNVASFTLSSASSTTRQWDIKVSQYKCGDTMGGPDGCLQYFTGITGTLASFNFPTSTGVVTSTATHLANQDYTMCIRRESSYCYICYSATNAIMTEDAENQSSFGLSNAGTDAINSASGSLCSLDYILIPGAQDVDEAIVGALTTTPLSTVLGEVNSESAGGRACGRVFAVQPTAQGLTNAYDPTSAYISVCTQVTPFRVHFHTDGDEVTGPAGASNTDELDSAPGGIVGFSLDYTQVAC